MNNRATIEIEKKEKETEGSHNKSLLATMYALVNFPPKIWDNNIENNGEGRDTQSLCRNHVQ